MLQFIERSSGGGVVSYESGVQCDTIMWGIRDRGQDDQDIVIMMTG